MNPFVTIRNNWKKSVFFASVLGYGTYSLKSYAEVTSHMRSICNDLNVNYNHPSETSRILVVLNPEANKRSAEKLFKKYSEPIFHLAGYNVEIFRTNSIGHAKSFIETLPELPDAIVVAGGEGTSSEVVTGLLRRSDGPCPIVLLPLGAKSEQSVKRSADLFKSKLAYVKALTDSSLSLVNGSPHKANVIQYDVVDQQSEKQLKPVYGLASFSWGLIKDIDALKDKYWLFGKLRKHAAVLFNSFSNKLIWEFETDYNYTPPCAGCQNCFNSGRPSKKPSSNAGDSFFKRLVVSKTNNEARNANQFLKVVNNECDNRKEGHLQTSQLYIDCKPNNENYYELETRVTDTLQPGLETIKKMNKIIENALEPSMVLRSRTIELMPHIDPDTETESFYSIDGEEYDVRPIKISLVPNAIQVYS